MALLFCILPPFKDHHDYIGVPWIIQDNLSILTSTDSICNFIATLPCNLTYINSIGHDKDLLGGESAHQRKGKGKKIKGGGIHEKKQRVWKIRIISREQSWIEIPLHVT